MQAYPGQGNPVLRALTGDISVRQLRVMLEHLPQSNPIVWEAQGHQWGDMHYLARDIANSGRYHYAAFSNVHKKKSAKEIEPQPIPSPDDEVAKRDRQTETRTPEQIELERNHFQAVLNRKRPEDKSS